jgi:glycosyltransferase involved in cell wall biosynthesis
MKPLTRTAGRNFAGRSLFANLPASKGGAVFSIAMATYNGEKYLSEQLRSLAEQTVLPDELVICDDESSDSTARIVELFAATAPFPVRFIRNEQRLGYYENFMKAAGLCTSEYIAFCDQDDVWLSEKLAVAQRYIRDTGCTLFQHGFRLIDAAGNSIQGQSDHWGLEGFGRWGMTRGMTQVFERSVLSFAPLRAISIDHCTGTQVMTHDQWILFINSLMGKVITARDVLVNYRQHGQNAIGYNTNQEPRSNLAGTFQINASRWMGKPEAYRKKRAYLITLIGRMAAGARSRAAIIDSLKPVSPNEKLALLEEDFAYYKQYEKYNEDRLLVYIASSKLERLNKVLSMYFNRSYQARGSRGVMDSTLDVLYGVMC